MDALALLARWPATAAAAVVMPDGSVVRHGDTRTVFELASVTKLVTAMAALVAHEEGTLPLDDIDARSGASVADLLAHSAGHDLDAATAQAHRRRRIYSTAAYERIGTLVHERSGLPFSEYLRIGVTEPLRMDTFSLHGSPGAAGRGSVDDLVALSRAWREPVLVHETTLERARRPHLPELVGVLPGFGRHAPNPWGLGPEVRGRKQPHWTASVNHPTTYGHFGQAGTMLWVDPSVDVTLIALCRAPVGPWAAEAWPRLSAAVLAEIAHS